MIKALSMSDFRFEKTKVEAAIRRKGHIAYFLPKFHPEINPIERVWSKAKQFTRSHGDHSFRQLEATVGPALDCESISEK